MNILINKNSNKIFVAMKFFLQNSNVTIMCRNDELSLLFTNRFRASDLELYDFLQIHPNFDKISWGFEF